MTHNRASPWVAGLMATATKTISPAPKVALIGLFSTGLVFTTPAFAVPTVTGITGCVLRPGATTQVEDAGGGSSGDPTPAPGAGGGDDGKQRAVGCAKPGEGTPGNVGRTPGAGLSELGEFAEVDSVNNALSNLQNQINNISNALNQEASIVTDGSTILGDGTAANPIRLNPEIPNRISAVEQVNATQNTQLNNHETRLNQVEAVNNQQNTRLDQIEQVNNQQNTRLDNLEGTVADHTTQINNLQQTVNNHETRITTVETKVASLETTVNKHETWINDVDAGKGIRNFRTNSTGPDAQAIGQKTVSIGAGSVAAHDNSVALGDGSVTDRANSVSVGSAGAERQITNVAAGEMDTDAANIAQLRALAAALGGGAGVGQGNQQTINGRAAGAAQAGSGSASGGTIILPTYTVQDRQYNNVGGAIAALDDSTVKYDRNEDGSKGNRITLRGGDGRKPVQIRGVADGVADYDAVNVRQLRHVATSSRDYTDVQIDNVTKYVNKRFDALSGLVTDARNEAHKAGAVALATSALRYDPRPGKFSVAGGSAVWQGQVGLAMGAGYNTEDGDMRFNASVSMADNDWAVAGGMSLTLN